MSKKRVLFISQEITPYLEETHISKIGRHLPQGIQEKGKEIRTFMPKFGCINERRNQLHEVIRLSGMNLVIDDNDHPLIIKVASIQPAKMQVYFIDNDDFFNSKSTLSDSNGKFFSNNDEKAIFFCRGVLETVKKLGWSPDLIHCHGWMTSLIPLLLKTSFKNEPIYENTKVVYSVYNDVFDKTLNKKFAKKCLNEHITENHVKGLETPSFINVSKYAMDMADGVILGDENVNQELLDYFNKLDKLTLGYHNENEYIDAYSAFYDQVIEQQILAE